MSSLTKNARVNGGPPGRITARERSAFAAPLAKQPPQHRRARRFHLLRIQPFDSLGRSGRASPTTRAGRALARGACSAASVAAVRRLSARLTTGGAPSSDARLEILDLAHEDHRRAVDVDALDRAVALELERLERAGPERIRDRQRRRRCRAPRARFDSGAKPGVDRWRWRRRRSAACP